MARPPERARGVRWDVNGQRAYFHLGEGGNEQNDIYAIDAEGEVEPIVELDGQSELYGVSADGKTLLVTSAEDGQMNLYVHDVTSDETAMITDNKRAVVGGQLSPDSERIAYATNESDAFQNMDVVPEHRGPPVLDAGVRRGVPKGIDHVFDATGSPKAVCGRLGRQLQRLRSGEVNPMDP